RRHVQTGRPLAKATVLHYVKTVKHFLAWAADRRGAGDDGREIELPRLRRMHRDVLTEAELQALEDGARNERDKLMVRVLAETGMREGELAGLTVDDIVVRDGRYHFLRIQGKTGQRMPPITPQTYRRLIGYRQGKAGRPKTADPHLFIADRRRAGGLAHEQLTAKGIYRALKLAADRAGLTKRVYVHLMRHTAITRMVAAGMHPALVSEITGVSVAVIAQHYSHPTLEQTHEALMRVLER
ncbi:MAG TPA: tyrosine-type recombinase/integrase, partial [Lentzea sp.]